MMEEIESLFCETCSIQFENKTLYKSHTNMCHSEKPFECEVCHKRFGERFTLKVHFRIHTGEKPYTCQYCKKQFSQACNLLTHKRKYHEFQMKTSKVKVNVNVVKQNQVLERHPCPHCRSVFNKIELLKNHIMQMHIKRTYINNNAKRSQSASSSVSSSSSSGYSPQFPGNNRYMAAQKSPAIKQEPEAVAPKYFGVKTTMSWRCNMCRLRFEDHNLYQRHIQAHMRQNNVQRVVKQTKVNDSIQVSNSSGQKIDLNDLVSKIKSGNRSINPNDESIHKQEVMKKLSGLGMDITLQQVKVEKRETEDYGLKISNVQSVSQAFFDDLEKMTYNKKRKLENGTSQKISPIETLQIPQKKPFVGPKSRRPKTETPPPSSSDDPLTSETTQTKIKEEKPNDDIILSSTRRTSRVLAYNEADQPRHITFRTKFKNGSSSIRRIFPCGKCTSKFENIETRKMHFLTVHGAANRIKQESIKIEKTSPVETQDTNPTLPINCVPQIIPAVEEDPFAEVGTPYSEEAEYHDEEFIG